MKQKHFLNPFYLIYIFLASFIGMLIAVIFLTVILFSSTESDIKQDHQDITNQ